MKQDKDTDKDKNKDITKDKNTFFFYNALYFLSLEKNYCYFVCLIISHFHDAI